MLVVLDTNVIVSGLLNGAGKPGKIIDLALDHRFQIAYDDRILGEYEDVLARLELRLPPVRVRAIISHIELMGQLIVTEPLSPEGFQDPNDVPFAEVFVTANADSLVTGNLRHFSPLIEKRLAIHTPAKFIEKFFPNN
jgi:putative PIN family toxin of toxin-antitoxin system